MPMYEYRCPQGHTFEQFRKMSDPKPDGCEVCGEGPVETVLYPVAVHYKGSGFYSTDYGRGGSKKKEGGGEGSSAGGDSGSGGGDSGSSGGGSGDSGSSAPKKEEPKKKAAEA